MGLRVNDRPSEGLGSWRVRRRFLFAVVVFCMGVIVYVLARDMRGGVAESAVIASFGCLFSSLGSYVFAAAWQDTSMDRHRHSDHYYPDAYRRPRFGRGRVDDPEDEP